MSLVASAMCWTPGAAVELQVLVDLRLLLGDRRLVDRELHLPRAVGDDLRHQRGVLGGDVVAHELLHVREAHDLVVEADPLVHPAELDVADAVVDRPGRCAGRAASTIGSRGDEAGQEGAVVAGALDQRVAGLAVGGDRGEDDRAVLVLERRTARRARGRRARPRTRRRRARPGPRARGRRRRRRARPRAARGSGPGAGVHLMTEVSTKRAAPDSSTYSARSRGCRSPARE